MSSYMLIMKLYKVILNFTFSYIRAVVPHSLELIGAERDEVTDPVLVEFNHSNLDSVLDFISARFHILINFFKSSRENASELKKNSTLSHLVSRQTPHVFPLFGTCSYLILAQVSIKGKAFPSTLRTQRQDDPGHAVHRTVNHRGHHLGKNIFLAPVLQDTVRHEVLW